MKNYSLIIIVLIQLVFLAAFHLVSLHFLHAHSSSLFKTQASVYLENMKSEIRLKQEKINGVARFFESSDKVTSDEFVKFTEEIVNLSDSIAICFNDQNGDVFQVPTSTLCNRKRSNHVISYFTEGNLMSFIQNAKATGGQVGYLTFWVNVEKMYSGISVKGITYEIIPNSEVEKLSFVDERGHSLVAELSTNSRVIFRVDVDNFDMDLPSTHYIILSLLLFGFIFLDLTILGILRREESVNKKVLLQTRVIEDQFKKIQNQHEMSMHASRLASLGEMASGVAHEINNPLLIINLTTRTIKKQIEQGTTFERVLELILDIEKTTARISGIVSAFRNVSRSSEFSKELVPFCELVDDLKGISAERLRSRNINLLTEGNLEVEILADRVHLSQVLINLIANAIDALDDRESSWIKLTIEKLENETKIRVIDSGPGISGDVRDKIFDPFFTTKDIGRGTGIGLSISRTILQKHGGSLELDQSAENTCFVITLPNE